MDKSSSQLALVPSSSQALTLTAFRSLPRELFYDIMDCMIDEATHGEGAFSISWLVTTFKDSRPGELALSCHDHYKLRKAAHFIKDPLKKRMQSLLVPLSATTYTRAMVLRKVLLRPFHQVRSNGGAAMVPILPAVDLFSIDGTKEFGSGSDIRALLNYIRFPSLRRLNPAPSATPTLECVRVLYLGDMSFFCAKNKFLIERISRLPNLEKILISPGKWRRKEMHKVHSVVGLQPIREAPFPSVFTWASEQGEIFGSVIESLKEKKVPIYLGASTSSPLPSGQKAPKPKATKPADAELKLPFAEVVDTPEGPQLLFLERKCICKMERLV